MVITINISELFNKTQEELTEEERLVEEENNDVFLAVYNNTIDEMYEITDEIRQYMNDYPYGSQDGIKDPKQIKVMAHYFNPVCGRDWVITEFYSEIEGNHYFYGAARLFDDVGWEWGILPSLEELKSINLGPAFGYLRIEKDSSVKPGDTLYDTLMHIEPKGLSDLGFDTRKKTENVPDYYEIYQIKQDAEEARDLMFVPYDQLKEKGMNVDSDNYDLVYSSQLNNETLDDIFDTFNIRRPEDFHGHSLSVSDVIVVHKDKTKAYYVDSFGFREVPEFISSGQERKAASQDQ